MEKEEKALTEREIEQLKRTVECWDRWDRARQVTRWVQRVAAWIIKHLKYLGAAVKWAAGVAPMLLIGEALGWFKLSEVFKTILSFLP